MVNYPIRSIQALGFLKSHSNDIEIYVEDEKCQQMYCVAFQRILGDKARINSVIRVGGKERVIAACRRDQKADGRPRLYIIDGDFDSFLGESLPKLKFLYRLDVYCFENLLISENACNSVARMSLTNLSNKEVYDKIKISEFLDESFDCGNRLYFIYGIAKYLKLPIQIVNVSITEMWIQTRSGPRISSSKVNSVIKNVLSAIIEEVGTVEYRRLKAVFKLRAEQLDRGSFISGKNFFIPLLYHRLKKLGKFSGTTDGFKVNLAHFFEVDSEPALRTRLRRTVGRR